MVVIVGKGNPLDKEGEGKPLHDQGDQDDDEGHIQDQMAMGERTAVVQGQWYGQRHRQGEHPSHTCPAENQWNTYIVISTSVGYGDKALHNLGSQHSPIGTEDTYPYDDSCHK